VTRDARPGSALGKCQSVSRDVLDAENRISAPDIADHGLAQGGCGTGRAVTALARGGLCRLGPYRKSENRLRIGSTILRDAAEPALPLVSVTLDLHEARVAKRAPAPQPREKDAAISAIERNRMKGSSFDGRNPRRRQKPDASSSTAAALLRAAPRTMASIQFS